MFWMLGLIRVQKEFIHCYSDKYIVHYENTFDIIRGDVVVDVKE